MIITVQFNGTQLLIRIQLCVAWRRGTGSGVRHDNGFGWEINWIKFNFNLVWSIAWCRALLHELLLFHRPQTPFTIWVEKKVGEGLGGEKREGGGYCVYHHDPDPYESGLLRYGLVGSPMSIVQCGFDVLWVWGECELWVRDQNDFYALFVVLCTYSSGSFTGARYTFDGLRIVHLFYTLHYSTLCDMKSMWFGEASPTTVWPFTCSNFAKIIHFTEKYSFRWARAFRICELPTIAFILQNAIIINDILPIATHAPRQKQTPMANRMWIVECKNWFECECVVRTILIS